MPQNRRKGRRPSDQALVAAFAEQHPSPAPRGDALPRWALIVMVGLGVLVILSGAGYPSTVQVAVLEYMVGAMSFATAVQGRTS